jgi:hypothetical protein
MALKTNITTLGPKVLPLSEQAAFGFNMLMRKIYGSKAVKQYVPNFGKAFEHICIHTGAARGEPAAAGSQFGWAAGRSEAWRACPSS